MKAAVIRGPRTAGFADIPEPVATAGFSRVRTTIVPLCTEFRDFTHGTALGEPLGHEAVGVIEETAPGSKLRVGDRVVVMPLLGCGRCSLCRSGWYIHCEHGREEEAPLGTLTTAIRKPDELLIEIPENLDDELASLACCGLGASFGAFERLAVTSQDAVLVTGLGPVGLGAVVNAVARGARVIGVDSNPYRSHLALELGAEAVVHPDEGTGAVGNAFGKQPPRVAIECSGVVPAQRTAIESVARQGVVAFVGNSFHPTPVEISADLIFKQVTLMGSWHYNIAWAPKLFEQIASHPDISRALITHRFPLAEIQSAWELQAGGQCGKVVLVPGLT